MERVYRVRRVGPPAGGYSPRVNLLTLRRAAHASPVAIVLLVVANLVPLAGVLLFGWSLITLLALYWLENGVIGVYACGRIATAEAIDEQPGRVEINGKVDAGRAAPGSTSGAGDLPPVLRRPLRAVLAGARRVRAGRAAAAVHVLRRRRGADARGHRGGAGPRDDDLGALRAGHQPRRLVPVQLAVGRRAADLDPGGADDGALWPGRRPPRHDRDRRVRGGDARPADRGARRPRRAQDDRRPRRTPRGAAARGRARDRDRA